MVPAPQRRRALQRVAHALEFAPVRLGFGEAGFERGKLVTFQLAVEVTDQTLAELFGRERHGWTSGATLGSCSSASALRSDSRA